MIKQTKNSLTALEARADAGASLTSTPRHANRHRGGVLSPLVLGCREDVDCALSTPRVYEVELA